MSSSTLSDGAHHRLDSMDPSVALQTARDSLFDLGNLTAGIVNEYHDVVSNSVLLEKLEDFRVVYEEAVARLRKPSFRIATIGTTSSGKSTIVNALIGRKIAPIEAQEMSAGILRIRHGERSKLVIHNTEGATWECGTWEDLRDEEIYSRLKLTMEAYHQERRKKRKKEDEADVGIPQIDVECPLLPVRASSLLNLPEGLQVEIYDLPGLNSIQDRTSLRIIQEHVSKCFSLVALDYSQTDWQRREALLRELKDVVEFLRGQTSLMIFLLNRVDMRNQTDNPLEQKVEELREEIKEILDLPELPFIIPLSAKALFYAQCAWGANSSEGSDVDPSTRQWMLSALFEDCANLIKASTRGDRELKSWIADLENKVEEGQAISDNDTRLLLGYIREWSGGNLLWRALRERIQADTARVVILPAVLQVINSAREISSALDVIINTRRIQTLEEVDRQRKYIQERQEQCKEAINQVAQSFIADITDLLNQVASASGTPESLSKIEEEARKKGWQGFPDFIDFVDEQVKDLINKIIATVRDALKQEIGVYPLEDSLKEVIPAHIANLVARSCDMTLRTLRDCECQGDSLILRVPVEEKTKKPHEKIERAERAVLALYQSVRDALEHRAEFLLQAKAQTFERFANSLISQLIANLIGAVEEILTVSEEDKLGIQELIQTGVKLRSEPLRLTQDVFLFNKRAKIETTKKDKTTIVEEPRSCFGGKKYKIAKVGTEFYQQLIVPSFDKMAEEWSSGADAGKRKLWQVLKEWIIGYMEELREATQELVRKALDLSMDELERQRKVIDENLSQAVAMAKDLENRKNAIESHIQTLSRIGSGSDE
ncbi:dynamin family protein [Synechococcus sp. H60.4]|uniref:dynamin family protein n=2 Tax=Synechococcus TaxID=1129 RepID=UPI0039C1F6CA